MTMHKLKGTTRKNKTNFDLDHINNDVLLAKCVDGLEQVKQTMISYVVVTSVGYLLRKY